ncbi:uncharacterized protein LOC107882269 [Acyrthosiphon pisum]|uniref:Uncharacterized protein n=1 Tax=Acyrthosiphon pisum TaxID=7029 RepID=A0A8R2D179_ACYPI|nr:uncharacterized protein LOC107882269 [Acyrthosiphon pisum]|eukprot:XP_016655887.1 PREDICTED: uncharacterized protein LOC107882269 [Acyrthosiphon pisum]
MCGCLSSTVKKDSTHHYGDNRYYHCEYQHPNFTGRKEGYVVDSDACGDSSNYGVDNCDSDGRDNGSDTGSCESFIGDRGSGHHGSDRSLDYHDVDPIWIYYDAENKRRDFGYFIAYRPDGCVGAFLAVRRADGGTFYEL